jgi:hypothetical protein
MPGDPLEDYLRELRDIRRSGSAVSRNLILSRARQTAGYHRRNSEAESPMHS